MINNSVAPAGSNFNPPTNTGDTFQRMVTLLHRGGPWAMMWDGVEHKSFYVPTTRRLHPPTPRWFEDRNCYFSVNPVDKQRPSGEATRNADVAAINAFLAEFDGKDFVREEEWLPFYADPCLEGLTPAKMRGALQKAQTRAIDAAYKANPDEYKRRALHHILALPVQPSALWDSGGGYQALWFLTEPLLITDDNRKQVALLYRKWVHFVGGDPAASDLRRVLRVPGSHNVKPKYAPNYPLVAYHWCDLERVFDLAELVAMLPEDAPRRTPRHTYTPATVQLPDAGAVPDLPRHPAIDRYNAEHDLYEQLLAIGYTEEANGRLSRPGADSGGVQLLKNNSAWVYSSSDALYCDRPVRPADVAVVYEHGGDVDAFMHELCGPYGGRLEEYQHAVLKAWIVGPDCAAQLRAAGAKRVEPYRRTLSALVNLMAENGLRLSIAPGYSKIARLTRKSVPTVGRHLATLFAGGLVDLEQPTKEDAPWTINLAFAIPFASVTPPPDVEPNDDDGAIACEGVTPSHVLVGGCNSYARYCDLAADDAFLGPYPYRFAEKWHTNLPMMGGAWLLGPDGEIRKWIAISGLTPADALVWAALEEHGDMTRAELCEETGIAEGGAGASTRRMVALGLLEQERQGRSFVYRLLPTAGGRLEVIRPALPTYGLTIKREEKALRGVIRMAKRAGDSEGRVKRLESKAQGLRVQAAAMGVDLDAKCSPPVGRHRPEKGRATAGTPAEWAAGVATGRRRAAAAQTAGNLEVELYWPDVEVDDGTFNAWAAVDLQESGWAVPKSRLDIVRHYKRFLAAEAAPPTMPTIRWAGDGMAAAAAD